MNHKEHFAYEANNEEEAEIAQIANLFENEARVRQARDRLEQEQTRKTQTRCVECDEPISAERQRAVPGVQLCIDCQKLAEKIS